MRGGVIATEQVARAAPDGKTLLFASSGSHVISAALRAGQLSYDAVKSFAPIAFVGAVPMLVIVSPDYPAKTLAELIAKAKTDKLSYGSAGAGSTMHIIGELINAEAGIKTTHVPYKGVAPALNDLLGGHIQLLSADLPVLEPLVKSGKVRALALFATERSPLLPDRADQRRARLSAHADEQLVRHAGAGRHARPTCRRRWRRRCSKP